MVQQRGQNPSLERIVTDLFPVNNSSYELLKQSVFIKRVKKITALMSDYSAFFGETFHRLLKMRIESFCDHFLYQVKIVKTTQYITFDLSPIKGNFVEVEKAFTDLQNTYRGTKTYKDVRQTYRLLRLLRHQYHREIEAIDFYVDVYRTLV
jgi:hypothetical protein